MTPTPAARILARCEALAAHTETPGGLTRTYLTDPHKAAHATVAGWMEAAGMTVRGDAVGNIIGRYEGQSPKAPALMIGSHLDTVRDAGKYDGMLGVLIGIAAVEDLVARGIRLPHAVEVIGFGDEEGVRFAATLIGSRAVAGTLDPALLDRPDADGITLAEALRRFGLDPARIGEAARHPEEILAYLEVHIEQGPVLEAENLPIGVVTAICGATRQTLTTTGEAGHAGTVPMGQRRDALAGAAEMILAIERLATAHGVVGTVGRIAAHPDAVNVIPGGVTFSLDLRAEDDARRAAALAEISESLAGIATRRGLSLTQETFHDSPAVACDPLWRGRFEAAIASLGLPVCALPSGAGHDAMALAALCPAAMLFVRCKGGISHNPAESVLEEDVAVALTCLTQTLLLLR